MTIALRPEDSGSLSRPPVHVITSEAEAIAVAERLAEEFRQGAARRDRERELPAAEIEALTRAGIYGITVPKEYGGADVSAVTVAEVFRILASADGSIGQIPQNHFCWLPTVANGAPENAEFLYRRVLAGDRIGNAHSEATLKRPGDYEHTLVRVDGGWELTGRKYYSTGALFAQWIPFLAYFDVDGKKEGRIFFVDAKTPGITLLDDWDGMGQRTTASGTTIFERVFVPDDKVFPLAPVKENGRSFSLNANMIHAAIDVGIAEAALRDAKDYILHNNRPWLGNPHERHAEEPFVVRDFGRLSVLARTARLSVRHAAAAIDAARATGDEKEILEARVAIADARLVASNAATTIADEFFLLTGGRATARAIGLDRHWRNARTHSLHDPLRWKEYHIGNYYLNGAVPGPGSYI